MARDEKGPTFLKSDIDVTSSEQGSITETTSSDAMDWKERRPTEPFESEDNGRFVIDGALTKLKDGGDGVLVQ